MSTEESNQNSSPKGETADHKANSASHDMARQGGIVSSMTLLSRVSGLVRDVVLSYLFGATANADMFFVAFRIPNFFRRMFAEGAFNQAFVPVLVRHRDQGRAALLAFIAPLSGLFGLSLILAVTLGVIFAPELTYVFAPGFADQPEYFAQTAELVRITFPYLGFISLVAYAGALLNTHNRFAVPAFTPVLLNMVLIAAALVALLEITDVPYVTVLAWGVLVAGVLQLVFQLPALVRMGLIVRPSADTQHPGVRQVGKLLVPAVLSASVGQINALVNTILASTLITGSISWLYYADRLLELPVGLVAVALGTVMLPHLSRMAANNDAEQFRRTLRWGVNLGLLLGIPAAVALYLLAQPLIAVLFMSFGSGAMTQIDVQMASIALQMFAVALPGFVLVKILAPAYFAHADTKTPFRYASVAVVVNLIGSLATYQWFGHVGLAWATAVSAWSHVALLYFGLVRQDKFRIDSTVWPMLWKTLVGSISLCGALVILNANVVWFNLTAMERGLLIVAVSAVGMLGYAAILWLLGLRVRDLRHSAT